MDYFQKSVSHLYAMEKHRGEIVEKAVRNSGIPLTKIARQLGIAYKTLYNKFDEVDLDFDFIKRMGDVIHYDFSEEIEAFNNPTAQEAPGEYKRTNALDKCQKDLDHWRNKAFEYIEKYNQMLEQNIELRNRQTG